MSFAFGSRHYLSEWISALLPAVPPRSRATFVELLCAYLVSPEGWVTRAIGSILRRCHWTTYYKLIERGSVRSVPLARALLPWCSRCCRCKPEKGLLCHTDRGSQYAIG